MVWKFLLHVCMNCPVLPPLPDDEQLPALEQIALVEEILHRLDAPDSSVDALWAIEAENRLTAYREGRVQAIG